MRSPVDASVGSQQSDIFPWEDSNGVLQFMFVNYVNLFVAFTKLTVVAKGITEIAGNPPPTE
jgi:hypothetical protein